MTMQTETSQALSALFQTPESTGPETGQPATAQAAAETDSAPRENGILMRDYETGGVHLDVQLDTTQLNEAAAILFTRGFYLESITGVDWLAADQLEAVYDFSRYDFDLCRVAVRVRVSRKNPVIPSITDIYTGANWHERETHDFFGIVFQGHPNLDPLLLPEDADFHPLLKDFKHEQTD